MATQHTSGDPRKKAYYLTKTVEDKWGIAFWNGHQFWDDPRQDGKLAFGIKREFITEWYPLPIDYYGLVNENVELEETICLWENSMMQAIGEDGVGSVVQAIEKKDQLIKKLSDSLKESIEEVYTQESKVPRKWVDALYESTGEKLDISEDRLTDPW